MKALFFLLAVAFWEPPRGRGLAVVGRPTVAEYGLRNREGAAGLVFLREEEQPWRNRSLHHEKRQMGRQARQQDLRQPGGESRQGFYRHGRRFGRGRRAALLR